MPEGWIEVEKLTNILEAEFNGHQIDRDEALGLATRIAEVYPDVGRTMGLVVQRMALAAN